MAFLSGDEIIRVAIGQPLERNAVQPAGYDLTLDEIRAFDGPGLLSEDARRIPTGTLIEPDDDGNYKLPPGYYRIRFREVIHVPIWAIGFCYPRSSLLRMGATINCAVWDPGYVGRGEALLAVFNPHGIILRKHVRIAQFVLALLETLPSKGYSGVFLGEGVNDTITNDE